MSTHFDDFEIEALEAAGLEMDLFPEDRENLEKAMNGSLEIFSAPGETDPERALEAIEILEEVHPYFSDTKVSDQIGEVIELLLEVSGEAVLSFEDAQSGRRIIRDLAQVLGIQLFRLDRYHMSRD